MNMVEIWFAIATIQQVPRGVYGQPALLSRRERG